VHSSERDYFKTSFFANNEQIYSISEPNTFEEQCKLLLIQTRRLYYGTSLPLEDYEVQFISSPEEFRGYSLLFTDKDLYEAYKSTFNMLDFNSVYRNIYGADAFENLEFLRIMKSGGPSLT